jgi:plastocyanin
MTCLRRRAASWIVPATLLCMSACHDFGGPTGGGGGGGGGGGSGPAAVTVGNYFFKSSQDGTQNPAVTVIAPGSTVTWIWNAPGSHSIQSTGMPSFPNSQVMSAAGSEYVLTFDTAGVYNYDCGVHGTLMTGRIVVH